MPHADTPPATPTPEGLARALALIDAYRFEGEYVPEAVIDFRAVFAVARAAVACEALPVPLGPLDTSRWEDIRRERATFNAAVARLCALATGAQAGEGAGG